MNNSKVIYDSWVMLKRCLRISLRNPEALLQATILPFLLMLLFGMIFGEAMEVGDFSYIDFIVPGIILQSIGQSSQYSAMNVAIDMTSGTIDRFRTMAISKSAILIGHTGAGLIRNTISTIVIIGTAFVLEFRPKGDFLAWCLVIELLLLVNTTMSLLGVLGGLASKTVEGASSFVLSLIILPFISSGFAPAETMNQGIRWFAQNQPMTPIIDSIHSLTLNLPIGNSFILAIVWCLGLMVVSFLLSLKIYQNRVI